MASQPNSAAPSPETVHRTLRHRLYPGDAETGHRLAGMAGACRYVWNYLLADCERRYALWKAYKIGPKPSVSFFTLGQRFTVLRNDPEHAWLKAYPAAVVHYTLKYLADAYKRFLTDPVNEGNPRFKARYFTTPGFTHAAQQTQPVCLTQW
jgi:transposase